MPIKTLTPGSRSIPTTQSAHENTGSTQTNRSIQQTFNPPAMSFWQRMFGWTPCCVKPRGLDSNEFQVPEADHQRAAEAHQKPAVPGINSNVVREADLSNATEASQPAKSQKTRGVRVPNSPRHRVRAKSRQIRLNKLGTPYTPTKNAVMPKKEQPVSPDKLEGPETLLPNWSLRTPHEKNRELDELKPNIDSAGLLPPSRETTKMIGNAVELVKKQGAETTSTVPTAILYAAFASIGASLASLVTSLVLLRKTSPSEEENEIVESQAILDNITYGSDSNGQDVPRFKEKLEEAAKNGG